MSQTNNNNRKPSARPSVNHPKVPKAHASLHASAPRPSAHAAGGARPSAHANNLGTRPSIHETDSAKTLVTRRRFLYGAVGAGAVVAAGVTAAALASSKDNTPDIHYLSAPATALTTLNELQALETPDETIQLVGSYDLPYGTLVWANDDYVAACLLPTETGSPLAQVGVLFLTSGRTTTVLEQAVGTSDGFEIYDARATSEGLVWTEANILQGTWRVYSAALTGDTLGDPQLHEEGNDTYDTPTLTVAGSYAFWQVVPKSTGSDAPESRLMRATFGNNNTQTIYEAKRRMGTPPYGNGNTVTISPRADMSSVCHVLTNIDAATGAVLDTLTLPKSVAPIECGYGQTGFMFALPDIYNLDGAISNLGTYTPTSMPTNGDYDNVKWFDFTRTPTAAPAWCGNLLIVKSSYSVCGVNLKDGTYFAIDVENGADTYGEYLASIGSRDTFVTYTNIDHTPVSGEAIHACRVKVWAPLA